jgi:hypothetical protein
LRGRTIPTEYPGGRIAGWKGFKRALEDDLFITSLRLILLISVYRRNSKQHTPLSSSTAPRRYGAFAIEVKGII